MKLLKKSPLGTTTSPSLLAKVAISVCVGTLLLAACAKPTKVEPSKGHFLRATNPGNNLPETRVSSTGGPQQDGLDLSDVPSSMGNGDVYSITVTDMNVRDLLFALARDANMNIDVYPGISGRVTLSALDQTLPQILDRIAKQVDLRYEIRDQAIIVSPDQAYLKIYKVDYVNVMRTSESKMKVSSQLSTAGFGNEVDMAGKRSEGNQSETTLTSTSTNKFWESLTSNISSVLNPPGETSDPSAPASLSTANDGGSLSLDDLSGNKSASGGDAGKVHQDKPGIVSINQDAGLVSVFATTRQHERIQQLLDATMETTHRQVMIESTVVEVELGDRYQEGVDWANIGSGGGGALFFNSLRSGSEAAVMNTLPIFQLPISSSNSRDGNKIFAVISALQRFGNTKVLSSPKIMALNNQTSILKVVENQVFFTLDTKSATVPGANSTSNTVALFNTNVHTVPVGLVMSVTPQISENDMVTLHVRPTISSISEWKEDPNPGLKSGNSISGLSADVSSRIPVVRVKEMESVLRVSSGQVAVMGGLMQDSTDKEENGIPGLSKIPILGALFRYRDESIKKSELVIFMRPVVMTEGRPKTNMAGGVVNPPTAPMVGQNGAVSGQNPQASSYLDFSRPPGTTYMQSPAVSQPQASEMVAEANTQAASPPLRAPSNPQAMMGQGGMGQGGVNSVMAGAPPMPAAPSPVFPGQPAGAGSYFVDLGTYGDPNNAETIYNRVSTVGLPIYRENNESGGKSYMRLRSGPYSSREEALQASLRITETTGIRSKIGTF